MWPIKQKINKAFAAIKSLPDVERSIGEQEEEMRMLEARIGGLKGRLGELGEIAGRRIGNGEGGRRGGRCCYGGH